MVYSQSLCPPTIPVSFISTIDEMIVRVTQRWYPLGDLTGNFFGKKSRIHSTGILKLLEFSCSTEHIDSTKLYLNKTELKNLDLWELLCSVNAVIES